MEIIKEVIISIEIIFLSIYIIILLLICKIFNIKIDE